MRHGRALALLLGAAILAAGCAAGPATTTSATLAPTGGAAAASAVDVGPTPGATMTVSRATAAAPAAAPTPTPAQVHARVTFDGTHCTYTGPTVIPSPAVLTIEYAPTPEMAADSVQFIAAMRHDVTEADIDRIDDDPSAPLVGDAAPEWAIDESMHAQQGPGTSSYDVHVWRTLTGQVFDQYIVSCVPSMPGRPIKGEHAVLRLVETGATPAP